ncbi:MAG: winged helix-turn-helix transcriptional regulator [Streptosporangiaceae bacterium]|nr:winged helix-turn-helix transcriptional regulator [Streptosporangiaceae bacterium]
MHRFGADDPRPRYEQVAGVFRGRIRDGQIPLGEKLPNHDQVRAEFGVSLGTVKRAYAVLEEEGLIVTRQGQGAYVRYEPGTPVDLSLADQLAQLRRDVTVIAERLAVVERRLAEQ